MSDEAAIRLLIASYARSIDTADPTMASAIWAATPDVSFIHPRGHERGWGAIKTKFYEQTMGQLFSERTLTVKDVTIACYGDTAWAEFYWDFVARLKDGSPLTTQGRETQVLRKGRWSMAPGSRALLRHAGHRRPRRILGAAGPPTQFKLTTPRTTDLRRRKED
jgi:ketosteroid isomerase-like protein